MILGISGKIGAGKDEVGNIIKYLCVGADKALISYDKWDGKEVWGSTDNKFHTSSYKIRKYADKLKDIVCLLIGCTREQLEDIDFKNSELGESWWYHSIQREISGTYQLIPYDKTKSNLLIHKLTPRKLLQLLGTECGRNIIHPNIWINSLYADYKPIVPHVRVRQKGMTASEARLAFSLATKNAKLPNWVITDMRFPNEAKAVKDRSGITIRVNRTYDIDKSDILNNPEKAPPISFHESETALDNYEFDYVIDNSKGIDELISIVKYILIKEKVI